MGRLESERRCKGRRQIEMSSLGRWGWSMIAAESEKRDILYTHTLCVFSHLQISLSGAGDDGVIDCGVGSVSFAPGHTSTSLSLSLSLFPLSPHPLSLSLSLSPVRYL